MVDDLLAGGGRALLKWPNDVLLRGAKVAGILIEVAEGAVIVGIGVNLRHAPADARYPVTTLAAECVAPLDDVMGVLLGNFARRFATWRGRDFRGAVGVAGAGASTGFSAARRFR